MNQGDSEEIVEVPLLLGVEEALKEKKPLKVEITTVPAKGKSYKDQLISIHCQNADLLYVLDLFAEISSLTLVVHPGVSGTVTVRFEDVPWEQALDIILEMNNLRFAIEGTVLRIFRAGAS